jgi:hypothetical protein
MDAYVRDEANGLLKSVSHQQLKMSAIYRPCDLNIYHHLGTTEIGDEKLSELRSQYADKHFFILSLSHADKELWKGVGGEQYSEILRTLSYEFSRFAFLTTSAEDTLEVADFYMERTYGLSNSTEVLVVFDSKENDGNYSWIELHIRELGLGMGAQKFKFFKSDILDVPELSFSIENKKL